jgi:methylenetetrahydrofolate--tRNA-(uracil-5-)-methyltransferase
MAERDRAAVVGAGLAGCEAALRLAAAGIGVDLYEMRPGRMTEAHRTGWFAELVCSNSLGSEEVVSGKGLLKEELRILGSALLPIADAARVPAGKALAVDRERFARGVTEAVRSRPGIRVVEEEVAGIPEAPVVVLACGPLAPEPITSAIRGLLGDGGFYFYDAISPIVDGGTVGLEAGYVADRYGAGTGDYLNLPMDRERYEAFLSALLSAKTVPLREFEEPRYFEGCMPVEEIARRGPETLLFGPLRPVGCPTRGRERYPTRSCSSMENAEGTMYNLVGFQTRRKYPEQKWVFSLLPGLGTPRPAVRVVTGTASSTPGAASRRAWSSRAAGALLRGQITGGGVRRVVRLRAGHGGVRAARALGREPLNFRRNRWSARGWPTSPPRAPGRRSR